MANIKFSAFTQKVALGDVDFLVGYTGADNVRVAPSVLSSVYLPLAGGTMTGDIVFNDNVKARFGTGLDAYIQHSGTNTEIVNATGDLKLLSAGTAILSAAGTEYIAYFAGTGPQNASLYAGNVKKFETVADGVNLPDNNALFLDNTNNNNPVYFRNAGTNAATLQIGRGTTPGSNLSMEISTGGDTTFAGDVLISGNSDIHLTIGDTTGDTFQFFNNTTQTSTINSNSTNIFSIFDGNVASGTNVFNIADGGNATFAGNVTMTSASSPTLTITDTTQTTTLKAFAQDSNAHMGTWSNHPLIIDSNSTTALTIDTSQNATFAGNVSLLDSKQLILGTSGNFNMFHDGSDVTLQNFTGDFNIVNKANDKDIIFQSDDGSGGTATYFWLDGSLADGTYTYTTWVDNGVLGMGTGSDLQLYHTGTDSYISNKTGDLYIKVREDDKDVILQSDDGSGGTTDYIRLDGSLVETSFLKTTHHYDNVKALFGDGEDLEIYHDGSHSYIADTGTGSLIVRATNWNLNNSANTQNMMVAVDGGAVSLFNAGVQKFQTSSTGVYITGQIQFSALNTAPASAGATGTLGEIRYTADYIYVCTATNTWKRTALSTW
jgi:hypothetical protein